MYRRDFLKLSGLLSAAVFIRFNSLGKAFTLPVEVQSQGKLFRGTPDGKIYVSANEGQSWQLHTNFGREIAILSLAINHKEQIQAQLGFANHTFELALAHNRQAWRTA
jgi:hypothetical protein